MPLRLDVKRKLLARSDRVKCVDLHPTETWMLVSLYNGNVHIWNYENQQLVKSFEVCNRYLELYIYLLEFANPNGHYLLSYVKCNLCFRCVNCRCALQSSYRARIGSLPGRTICTFGSLITTHSNGCINSKRIRTICDRSRCIRLNRIY